MIERVASSARQKSVIMTITVAVCKAPLSSDLYIMYAPYTWPSGLIPFALRMGNTEANSYNSVFKARSRKSIVPMTQT